MTPSDLIGLVGAAAGVLGAAAALASGSHRWIRWCLLILAVALFAAVIFALPTARANWPTVTIVAVSSAAVAALAWYLVMRALDLPPRGDFTLTMANSERLRNIGVDEAPLALHGTYFGTAVSVRVLLKGSSEGYHVQEPAIELRSDQTWIATNVQPRGGITELAIVVAGHRGKRLFDNLLRGTDPYGAKPLPKNCRIVAVVPVNALAMD
jgi:hypothetical protein